MRNEQESSGQSLVVNETGFGLKLARFLYLQDALTVVHHFAYH